MEAKEYIVCIDRNKLDLFKKVSDRLKDNCDKPTFEPKNQNVFFLAASLGFYNDARYPIMGPREGITRLTYLKDDEIFLAQAFHLKDKDIMDVDLDIVEALKTAEEYANAGLDRLKELMEEQGSFRDNFLDVIIDSVFEIDVPEEEDHE